MNKLPITNIEDWKLERHKGCFDFYSRKYNSTRSEIIGFNTALDKCWHIRSKRHSGDLWSVAEGIVIFWEGNFFDFKSTPLYE